MTIGGDPDEIERLAGTGPGQAFRLRHAADRLDHDSVRHRRRNPSSTVLVAGVVAGLHQLAEWLLALDDWTRAVAVALREADTTSLRPALLALGADHPLARTNDTASVPQVLRSSSDEQLAAAADMARLPPPLRDAVHRERLRRWVADLDVRLGAVPDDDRLDLLTTLADRWLVDGLSPVVDLHRTATETRERLRREAAAARRITAMRGCTVLSFGDDDPPTLRVAFGNTASATHVIVLLPGTSTGLHAADASLADAVALHELASRLAPAGAEVATVLDLYAAPADLGRAADPVPARTAGAATAAFLADLPGAPRTTLVGHSYGALAAARASDGHPVADLVLLGAPGVGVDGRDDLAGAERVWAARAAGDPIAVVADLDEVLAALPQRWRPTTGPLADPLVAHGPDPTDREFGALRLPTAPPPGGIAAPGVRGHLDYLRPGTASLTNVALVAVGRGPVTGTAGTLRRARPPRRDRRARGADE